MNWEVFNYDKVYVFSVSYAQIFEANPEEAVIKAKEIADSIAKKLHFNYDLIEIEHRNRDLHLKKCSEFSISIIDTNNDASIDFQVIPDPKITESEIADIIKSGKYLYNEVVTDITNLKSYARWWNILIMEYKLNSDEKYNMNNPNKLEKDLKLDCSWPFTDSDIS